MILKKCFCLALIILVTVSAVGQQGCIEKQQELVKIGIVFEACGLDDAFNNLCFAGAQRAEDELGISSDYVIAIAAPEFEDLQRRYAESGEYAPSSALVRIKRMQL